MDRDSASWVQSLGAGGSERETAVAELHALMVRVAHAEATRRAGTHGVRGVELEDIAQQAAGDAVVSILRKLTDFRGDSKFTTWAYKFAVFEVASKLGRHAWRRDGVRLDQEAWNRLPGRLGAAPEESAQARELTTAVQHAVHSVLTGHQREVFLALVVTGTPLDVLVAELGTTRNAVYKTMFDARRKLRAHLVADGYLTSA